MKRDDRLHIRAEKELMAWLRRSAAKRRTTVSETARQVLYAAFETRHAK
jgi:hypothetical protein